MKLKKILCVLTAAFMAMTLLAGCGGGGDKKEADSKAKSEMKVMRVAGSIDFAPFEFQDETKKEYQGFDMDLIRAIGKEMGVKVEISNITFDGLIPALEAGNIDAIISGMTINDARKKKVLFSDAYYESGLTMVVASDNSTIKTFKDLEGKKVAVQIGTTSAAEVRKIKDVKITELDTPSICFMELMAGNVDAVVNDRPVNDYFISRGFDGVKALPERLTAEEYGIAINKKNPELQKKVNAALKKLREKGEYQKIFDKWFAAKKVK
ncbi:MAG: basic amino acid ABC transporter substrate-binding protein [Selenomonadaceae bacterium]|nr:basic amino acid ABC transporter substrate-binding protein [Selenomonadaceae bacterium]